MTRLTAVVTTTGAAFPPQQAVDTGRETGPNVAILRRVHPFPHEER